ncbi:XRE family transcriptional regulator [Burkholderia metallica]|nr:XRE family transcriptional regulator [Burkholderia metallica]NTZ86203.1 XRE family transcriptional regulator [Burkholderia metallica]
MDVNDYHVQVRAECLRPGEVWTIPTGPEVRTVVDRCGFSGRQAANFLGLADKSGRHIRRWISGESPIPYAAWALLCHAAGLGLIWESK